jgi:hypothetical protein
MLVRQLLLSTLPLTWHCLRDKEDMADTKTGRGRREVKETNNYLATWYTKDFLCLISFHLHNNP